MALTPAALTHIDQFKDLKTRAIVETGKLSKALTDGNLHTFNFSQLNAILAAWETKNKTLIATEASSQAALYQNRSGKVTHVGGRWIFLGVIICGIAYVVFSELYSTDPKGKSSGLYSTLAIGATGALQMLNEMGKNYSDEEATAIQLTPPENPKALAAAQKAVDALKIIKKGTDGAQAALEAYQKAYPKLPGKIKKILPSPENWHPDILAKISQVLASIDTPPTPDKQTDTGGASSSNSASVVTQPPEESDPFDSNSNRDLRLHIIDDPD